MRLGKNAVLYIGGLASILYFYGALIQPIYLLFPVMTAYSLMLFTGIQKYPLKVAISYFLLMTLTLTLLLLQLVVHANPGVLFNFTLCLFCLFSVGLITWNMPQHKLIKLLIFMIKVIILYSLIDGVWRLLHPNPEQIFPGNPFFYRYKDNSLMFEDSNFVGALLAVTYGCYSFLRYKFGYQNRSIIFFIYLAAILTFSRASIIAMIALEGYKVYIRLKPTWRAICIIAFLSVLGSVYGYLVQDGSFRTKFYIIDLFLQYYPKVSDEHKLLGIGLGNTFDYLGIGAHSILVVYAFELGVLGSILQLLIFTIVILLSRKNALFILIPYAVNGFSLTAIAIPAMFIFLAFITSLSFENRNNESLRTYSNL